MCSPILYPFKWFSNCTSYHFCNTILPSCQFSLGVSMTVYLSVNLTITVDLTFHWLERHSAFFTNGSAVANTIDISYLTYVKTRVNVQTLHLALPVYDRHKQHRSPKTKYIIWWVVHHAPLSSWSIKQMIASLLLIPYLYYICKIYTIDTSKSEYLL